MSTSTTTITRMGLGCMSMGKAGAYGTGTDDEGIRTIQAAIERGITFLDTGDFYSMGDNEMLVGRAIQGRRDKVTLSVKFGGLRGPDGTFLGLDMRPALVKSFCAYSLKRLGVEVIDIYRPCRLDPNVPIEDTIGAITDLIKAGYVRQIGLSEMGPETIRRAHKVHPIADLQIEYSIASRGPEDKIFPVLHELGIGATLYGVLSRGLLSGSQTSAKDMRSHLPRFSGANAGLVEKLRDFAGRVGQTPAQVCVGWVMAKEPKLMPLLGARKPSQLDAFDAKPLTPEQVTELEKLIPRDAFSGPRYPEAMMAHLDSEK